MARRGARLDPADRDKINRTVAGAESRTEAEIVPVVAAASGRYDRAEDLVGIWFGAIAAAVTAFLTRASAAPGSWAGPSPLSEAVAVAASALLGAAAGSLAAGRWWPLRRLFLSRTEQAEEVESKARQAFYDARVHHTAGCCGLLIYVSLFERQAVVLADRAVTERLGEPALRELCDGLIASIKSGSVPDALCGTIAAAGDRLAVAFPRAGEPTNELPDAVVLID